MNKTFSLLAVLALVASPVLVACASEEAPAQQEGLVSYRATMTEAEANERAAQLKAKDGTLDESGTVCRVVKCSYGEPDADGLVVFESVNTPQCDCHDCAGTEHGNTLPPNTL